MVTATGMSRGMEEGRFAVMASPAHIRQSIADIVSTPIGTRVMRPEYGSRLPRLVDRPVGKGWELEALAAVAEALWRWEPRVRVERVRVGAVGPGSVELSVTYRLVDGTLDEAQVEVGRSS